MNTPTPYTERTNQLRSEATDIITKIRAAETGDHLGYEQFCALLQRKNSLVVEANRIVREINHTLNIAARSPSDRLPYPQCRDLRDARKIAREIIDLVHSSRTLIPSEPEQIPVPTAPAVSEFALLDDNDEDYQLPF